MNAFTCACGDPNCPFAPANYTPELEADLFLSLALALAALDELEPPVNDELEAALAEVEAGNELTTDEAGVLAEEIYRLEQRENDLETALSEAEDQVDELLGLNRELGADLNDLAVENTVVWLANNALADELDISHTLNLVGATALAEAHRLLELADAIITAQAAELKRLQARETARQVQDALDFAMRLGYLA